MILLLEIIFITVVQIYRWYLWSWLCNLSMGLGWVRVWRPLHVFELPCLCSLAVHVISQIHSI